MQIRRKGGTSSTGRRVDLFCLPIRPLSLLANRLGRSVSAAQATLPGIFILAPPSTYHRPQEVPYPPGEEDDDHPVAAYQSHALSSTSQPQRQMAVQLPSIHDSHLYGAQPSGRGYPHHQDPRSPGGYGHSPTNANGYQPPPSTQAYLPPVQPSLEARSANYGPEYYSPQRASYGAGFDPYRQPHPGPYPDRGYPAEYGRGGPTAAAAPLQQAAPRQRTSIACKYCRRRKVRQPRTGEVLKSNPRRNSCRARRGALTRGN